MKQTNKSDPNDEEETHISCGGLSLSFAELKGFDEWYQDDDAGDDHHLEYAGYFAISKHHDVDDEDDDPSHSDIGDLDYIDDILEAASFDSVLEDMSTEEQQSLQTPEDVAVSLLHKMTSCGPGTPASELFETHWKEGEQHSEVIPVLAHRRKYLPALLKVLRQVGMRPRVAVLLGSEDGKDPFTYFRVTIRGRKDSVPWLRMCKAQQGFTTPNTPFHVGNVDPGGKACCSYSDGNRPPVVGSCDAGTYHRVLKSTVLLLIQHRTLNDGNNRVWGPYDPGAL